MTNIFRLKKIATAVAFLFLLGACTGVIPGTGPQPDLYTLSPKSTFPDSIPLVSWQLVVEEPIAAGGLNTQNIALRTTQLDLKYFAGARWTERSTRLMQTLMVESFENSGKIMAVGRQVIGLRSDINVKSELREFQAEYFDGVDRAPNIRVRLNVKLIRQPRREIVASRTFETIVRSSGTSMRSIVETFDEAVGKVLKDVVTWTLSEGEIALSNR